jgi:hypothetical protein
LLWCKSDRKKKLSAIDGVLSASSLAMQLESGAHDVVRPNDAIFLLQ